ncbi:MAG: hypothetical protein Q9169_007256 [Polycauliona sp. 2 TL-2023]
MDLPNELTLNIMSSLLKKDIKEARLVCKLWGTLGAKSLFDTIYVSPRETDMVVFDAITQHPSLRYAPRRLIYDSADFEQLTETDYAWEIWYQYDEGTFNALGGAVYAVQEMIRYIPEDVGDGTTELDAQLRSHPVFERGFREYIKHANEYGNVFTRDWSSRVYRGLGNLGPIVSVSIRNTWNMIYDEPDGDVPIRDVPVRSNYNVSAATLVAQGYVHADGTRLVGSPSARAYSSTALPPGCAEIWIAKDPTQMMTASRVSPTSGFLGILNLLSTAGKRPTDLRTLGGLGADLARTGISVHVFDPTEMPEPVSFLQLAGSLKSLQLDVSDTDRQDYSSPSPYPNIRPLQQFLRHAHSLEALSLRLPGDFAAVDLSIDQTPFNFCPLFSDTQPWLPPALEHLELAGFSASYRELGTHIGLCLPNLTRLFLGQVLLAQGSYEDLLNDFGQPGQLETFGLSAPMYYSDGEQFLAPAITPEEKVEQQTLLDAICNGCETGKDIPDLGQHELRDFQFNKWLEQMKTRQREIMTAYIGHYDTSGRLRQSFPHSTEFTRFAAMVVKSYKTAPSIHNDVYR